MQYFHTTLVRYGFEPQRPGFYTRPASSALGGTLYCTVGEDERPRKMLLWQRGRILIQADAVSLAVVEQVLQRVLGIPAA